MHGGHRALPAGSAGTQELPISSRLVTPAPSKPGLSCTALEPLPILLFSFSHRSLLEPEPRPESTPSPSTPVPPALPKPSPGSPLPKTSGFVLAPGRRSPGPPGAAPVSPPGSPLTFAAAR